MPYVPPPADLSAYPGASRAKPKTSMGDGQKRKRWVDDDRIYEWDYQHGTVEIYDKRGKHLGEYDPNTGAKVADADNSRSIEP